MKLLSGRIGPFFLLLFLIRPLYGQDSGGVSFNQNIRPILADICFNCHGPDEAANEGGVRLDKLQYAIREGDSGELTVVPGDSENSELVRRVFDEDSPMPPEDFHKQLTDEQKMLLKRWVDEGAKYEGHWAFAKPLRPELPAVVDEKWSRNPIDRFVLAKLESVGMKPSPEASKRTLIRRLALDLTGLPPTLDEINDYLSDDSPDAYEKVVDRFLGKEAFGEKMARAWLDQARYADSNGFQSDGSRTIWPWREWVINAYNRNLPFDQFTIEQLAGDMLPNPTRDQMVATGFNRNHRLNGEGGRIVDEWFVETVIDRVETTGLTWLGLTMNCCRCHDHKYDPISQKEFYQMFAFFNSVEESGVLAPRGDKGQNTPPLYHLKSPTDEARLVEYASKRSELEQKLSKIEKEEEARIKDWIASLGADAKPGAWRRAEVKKVKCKQGTEFVRLADSSFLATGKNPDHPVYELKFPLKGKRFSGLMIEAFADQWLPKESLGRSPDNGNFVLTDVVCEIASPAGKRKKVKFVTARADYSQPGWDAQKVLVREGALTESASHSGWGTFGFESDSGKPNRIMLKTESALEVAPKSVVHVRLYHRSVHNKHALGRFRVNYSVDDPESVEWEDGGIEASVLAAAKTEPGRRSARQKKQLLEFFREQKSEYTSIRNRIIKLDRKRKDFELTIPSTMVMKEGKRRDAFLLDRGEYDKPAAKVERGLPAFLPPMPEGESMDRLGFARWIVDESNPLTARVWVNRVWQDLLGTGIVKSTENFGTQADYPTHPRLLDWLAVEFRDPQVAPAVNGQPAKRWDMKAFIKLVVTSATYRQSSNRTDIAKERDPENRWLSHGSRFRLDGETIRDQALFASGLLVEKIGGPSVRPYMPEGIWDETSRYGNLRNYKSDKGDGRYRRTIYTIWKRTAAPPTMLLFDAPNRETCTIRRSRTNTPLQALSLLNENTFVEAAQSLAQRMVSEGGDTAAARIGFGFELLTARRPTERESAVLVAGLEDDLKLFRAAPDKAKLFLEFVDRKYSKSLSEDQVCEQAAYALAANVLLNLDEVVSR